MPEVEKAKGKIQATKRWLTRAEEHFDRNAQMRGQMDLLLAEAELRSTRESVADKQGWTTKSWASQSLALLVAVILVVAGMSGTWWVMRNSASEPHLASPVIVPVVPSVSAPVQKISTVPAQRQEIVPAATVETTKAVQEVKTAEKSADREMSASPDEMKRLIQTAGQTLRGRTK